MREIWQAVDSNSAGQRAFPINYGRSSVYQTAASVSGCSASKAAFRFAWDMASCNIGRITANAACSSGAMLFQNLINFVALQDVGHQGLDRALHGLTLGKSIRKGNIASDGWRLPPHLHQLLPRLQRSDAPTTSKSENQHAEHLSAQMTRTPFRFQSAIEAQSRQQ